MSDRMKSAFDEVKADENLKASTMAYINGERARREKKKPAAPRFRMAFAAALVAFVAVIGGGYSVYAMPEAYVSIDVNPSVELALNRFDRVLSATAYNGDGEIVLEGLDLKNERYTDAVDMLIESDAFQAYLTEENDLTITVVSGDEDALITGIMGCRAVERYNAYCTSADEEIVQEAHGYGMSIGKYQASLQLCQYDDSVTLEDCRGMTMREIRDMTSQHQGNSGSGSGSGSGTSGGSGGSGSGTNGGSGYHGGK